MQFSVFAYLQYRKKTTKEGKTENIDMKKTWGQYIAATGAGIFLAAAAGYQKLPVRAAGEETDSSAGTVQNPVVLNYWIWDDEEYYISKIVDAFEMTHPGIEIELHIMENYIYDDKIKDVVKSEEPVDLLGIRGVTKIVDYQEEGLLLELNDYLARSPLDTTAYGNMFGTYAIDDRYYGLPTRCTCWVLYYNKEIFDAEGVAYPGQMTWEEYARLAKQLTNNGTGDDKIWGGYFADWCYQFAGVQRKNYLYDDDISDTLEGLQLLNRFYNVDKSHPPLSAVMETSDEYLQFFEDGNVAMMPQGEWVAGLIMEDVRNGRKTADWDIAPMPVFEGQDPYSTWGQYQFAGITSECEHPQEAFEFLSWLCGEGGAQIIAGSGNISGYMDDEIRKIYRDSLQGKNVDVFFKSQRVLESPPRPEYNEILAEFTDIAEEYLLQNITFEEARAKLEAKRQELYAR